MSLLNRIPDETNLPELTLRGIIIGALITVIFTASNVYLGLKIGFTFSSSIPAAVISMAVLRMLKTGNILENNMVQTQASSAGTLSAVIFVLPGLVMMGQWHGFPFWETFGICAAGGMLGVLFSIPLRHVMVVRSTLPYPEGVAAAEILRVGSVDTAVAQASAANKHEASATQADKAAGDAGIRDLMLGGIVAAAVNFAADGLRVLSDSINGWWVTGSAVFRFPMAFSLALVGAGYLMGIVGGIAMLVGTLIAWGIAVPVLTSTMPLPAGTSLIAFASSLWSTHVRYIGAGTIGIAAIWTLVTLFKPMLDGIKVSFSALRGAADAQGNPAKRTEQDLSPRWIIGLSIALFVALLITFSAFMRNPMLSTGVIAGLVACGVLFTFVFGFLVASACGYMAGLVGSSSSPLSGIGIVAMIFISLLLLGFDSLTHLRVSHAANALMIAAAIFTTSAVIAVASIANDNLQDLKTGWLVGATPWRQQVALLIGCVVGALVISPVLNLLYNAYGFAGAMPHAHMDPAQALSAPQATLMTAIANGIFAHDLDWSMILLGVAIGVAVILIDWLLGRNWKGATLPALAVGIGIYLPPSINMCLIVGALLSWLIKRRLAQNAAQKNLPQAYAETAERRGVLLASGMIAGESLIGIVLAAIISLTGKEAPLAIVGKSFAPVAQWLGLVVFVLACYGFYRRVVRTYR